MTKEYAILINQVRKFHNYFLTLLTELFHYKEEAFNAGRNFCLVGTTDLRYANTISRSRGKWNTLNPYSNFLAHLVWTYLWNYFFVSHWVKIVIYFLSMHWKSPVNQSRTNINNIYTVALEDIMKLKPWVQETFLDKFCSYLFMQLEWNVSYWPNLETNKTEWTRLSLLLTNSI